MSKFKVGQLVVGINKDLDNYNKVNKVVDIISDSIIKLDDKNFYYEGYLELFSKEEETKSSYDFSDIGVRDIYICEESKGNKYTRKIVGRKGGVAYVDVYDVLTAFKVENPALQHLIKKALCVGIRGHKDSSTDLQDIIDSAIRAKELQNEN